MSFRIPFQISRAGALCRPTSPISNRFLNKTSPQETQKFYQFNRNKNILDKLDFCKKDYLQTKHSRLKMESEQLPTLHCTSNNLLRNYKCNLSHLTKNSTVFARQSSTVTNEDSNEVTCKRCGAKKGKVCAQCTICEIQTLLNKNILINNKPFANNKINPMIRPSTSPLLHHDQNQKTNNYSSKRMNENEEKSQYILENLHKAKTLSISSLDKCMKSSNNTTSHCIMHHENPSKELHKKFSNSKILSQSNESSEQSTSKMTTFKNAVDKLMYMNESKKVARKFSARKINASIINNMVGLIKVAKKTFPILQVNDCKQFQPAILKKQYNHSPEASWNSKTNQTTSHNIFESYTQQFENFDKKDEEEKQLFARNKKKQQNRAFSTSSYSQEYPNVRYINKVFHQRGEEEQSQLKRNYSKKNKKCEKKKKFKLKAQWKKPPAKFKVKFCGPVQRRDCEDYKKGTICKKQITPYESFGENFSGFKEREKTECENVQEKSMQPKHQVSTIPQLLPDVSPKVTAVDPAFERNCLKNKNYIEPERNVPIKKTRTNSCKSFKCKYCSSRGREGCDDYQETICKKQEAPYKCFSDKCSQFNDIPFTECNAAAKKKVPSFGKNNSCKSTKENNKCKDECDTRSGEPKINK